MKKLVLMPNTCRVFEKDGMYHVKCETTDGGKWIHQRTLTKAWAMKLAGNVIIRGDINPANWNYHGAVEGSSRAFHDQEVAAMHEEQEYFQYEQDCLTGGWVYR